MSTFAQRRGGERWRPRRSTVPPQLGPAFSDDVALVLAYARRGMVWGAQTARTIASIGDARRAIPCLGFDVVGRGHRVAPKAVGWMS